MKNSKLYPYKNISAIPTHLSTPSLPFLPPLLLFRHYPHLSFISIYSHIIYHSSTKHKNHSFCLNTYTYYNNYLYLPFIYPLALYHPFFYPSNYPIFNFSLYISNSNCFLFSSQSHSFCLDGYYCFA